MDQSEVAQLLIGFLVDDNPALHSVDILLQNGIIGGYIQEQPPPLFKPNVDPSDIIDGYIQEQQPPLFEPNVDPNDIIDGYIQEQPPPLFEPNVDPSDIIDGYIQEQPPPLFEPNVDPSTMADCNAPNLSAQTVAARNRRKRISQKTQELARLIPGGNKLSTADMLQAAYKYIEFLQAQLSILQLMASSLECRSSKEEDEYLHVLVTKGMCIVPQSEAP